MKKMKYIALLVLVLLNLQPVFASAYKNDLSGISGSISNIPSGTVYMDLLVPSDELLEQNASDSVTVLGLDNVYTFDKACPIAKYNDGFKSYTVYEPNCNISLSQTGGEIHFLCENSAVERLAFSQMKIAYVDAAGNVLGVTNPVDAKAAKFFFWERASFSADGNALDYTYYASPILLVGSIVTVLVVFLILFFVLRYILKKAKKQREKE